MFHAALIEMVVDHPDMGRVVPEFGQAILHFDESE